MEGERRGATAQAAGCGTDPVGQFTVEETDQEVVVRGLLPGYDEGGLDVKVDGGVLAIRAEPPPGGRPFSQRVGLPAGVDPGRVQATFVNDVLQVHLFKAAP